MAACAKAVIINFSSANYKKNGLNSTTIMAKENKSTYKNGIFAIFNLYFA
jgi:hypothetical protein